MLTLSAIILQLVFVFPNRGQQKRSHRNLQITGLSLAVNSLVNLIRDNGSTDYIRIPRRERYEISRNMDELKLAFVLFGVSTGVMPEDRGLRLMMTPTYMDSV
jgi:hypothetical protein